jgi:hypothetical protein
LGTKQELRFAYSETRLQGILCGEDSRRTGVVVEFNPEDENSTQVKDIFMVIFVQRDSSRIISRRKDGVHWDVPIV